MAGLATSISQDADVWLSQDTKESVMLRIIRIGLVAIMPVFGLSVAASECLQLPCTELCIESNKYDFEMTDRGPWSGRRLLRPIRLNAMTILIRSRSKCCPWTVRLRMNLSWSQPKAAN